MQFHLYQADSLQIARQTHLEKLLLDLPDSLHARAHRYKSPADAYNFVIGRLLLKQGLEELGLAEGLEDIRIEKDGKPQLSSIHFNISHTEGRVICALSTKGPLGIDVEKIRPVQLENFVAWFTTAEWTDIQQAREPLLRFYWYWTRKESIIKALGVNLSYLHRVAIDPTLDHVIVEGKRWELEDLAVGAGFFGAVCFEKNDARLN